MIMAIMIVSASPSCGGGYGRAVMAVMIVIMAVEEDMSVLESEVTQSYWPVGRR